MERRTFLTASLNASLSASGAIALLTSAGCSSPDELQILGLNTAIPSRSLREFEQKSGKTNYRVEPTPDDLWKRLQNPENPAHVLSLGDSWLDRAIKQAVIQPLSAEMLAQIPNWQKLGRWQALGTRGKIRDQQVWGIPYRWGTTAIIYQQTRVKPEITSWADLWRPELKRKIILPDEPAEVLGLVLKKLGHSYAAPDPLAIGEFSQTLQALHRQVLTYSSSDYLQPLVVDDALVAVGWSVDLVRATRQYPELKVVIPQEGTALWADLWVIPKSAKVKSSALNWINTSLEPQFSAQIAALTDANSPIDSPLIPESVRLDRLKFLDAQFLEKCEFIGNLDAEVRQQQLEVWQKLRRGETIVQTSTPVEQKNMEFIGTIKKAEVGIGAWTLVTDQGTVHEILQPVDRQLLKQGQKVKIIGKLRPDVMTTAMVGIVLEVTSFTILRS